MTSGVVLWVKAEPFTYGALPAAPPTRLSHNNIKKIVSYAKTKGKLGFPRLSYSVWRHIACNKLQLPEDTAWMYFSSYESLRENVHPKERIETDKRLSRSSSTQETEHIKSQSSVPTLEFVLFLYIQHLHKISLRASLVSGSEEWPMRARSPDLESGRSTPTGGKGLDEHGHMTFVLNNLNEILELLVEPDAYGTGTTNDLTLSLEAVESLGFLIGGSMDKGKNIRPLQEIALTQQIQQKSGYSKISRSFAFRSLHAWLRSHLGQNPFGISLCISSGRRLSWPLSAEQKDSRDQAKRGRIATNALIVPRDHIKGNKIIILSQVCKQTVARCSGTLEGSSVKIHRCHFSYLYLLSSLRSVSVEKCRNSTIVLGPVETTIHINNCENVTVIAMTRRLSISASANCTLHLLTPTRPLVLSGNDTIILAPYHTLYGKLEEHLNTSGLSVQPNLWDKPLYFGTDFHDDTPACTLMSPEDFYLFSIPFEMEGPTKTIPGGIPAAYQRGIRQRDRAIENWQKMVKEEGLTKEQRKQFQSVVEQRFQEWLSDSGNKRQLDGLATHGLIPSRKK